MVSFDNSQYSELAPVHITSLSHETQNLGELAAELMLRLLQGERCQSEVVPWSLEEKEDQRYHSVLRSFLDIRKKSLVSDETGDFFDVNG